MSTTADILYQSSTRINEEISNSLMDVDDEPIVNHSNHEQIDVFHQGNPVLNKSFDVLPEQTKTNNVLDTTVELPNTNDVLDEKPSQELNVLKPVNNIETSPNTHHALLSNQFSIEYPYALPHEEENLPSVESMAGLNKSLKLNHTKSIDSEPLINEKPVDTSTFVLKRKERRKTTVQSTTNENALNGTVEEKQLSIDATRIIDCMDQYYRFLYRVCECTEELKQELRHVKNERDQISEDLIKTENAFTDIKKRNEKLKLIINEHKTNTDTLKRFSEESVRYTEEQKQKYAMLKQHAQEKLNEANSEIERLRRTQNSEMEGVQAQLRYSQLRVQSLEQELKSAKLELEQKKKENIELTNICDELLTTTKK